MMSERVVAAATRETESVVADDVLGEPDATRTQDTTLIVEHDARAEINRLGLVNLRFDEPAGRLAVVHRIFLKFAFAGLVADRAVERMVDEQELEHAFTHLLRRGRTRVNLHAGRNRRCAGDGAAWR